MKKKIVYIRIAVETQSKRNVLLAGFYLIYKVITLKFTVKQENARYTSKN